MDKTAGAGGLQIGRTRLALESRLTSKNPENRSGSSRARNPCGTCLRSMLARPHRALLPIRDKGGLAPLCNP
ncbi:hypothetical protein, partial [Burkholderia sp. Ac-20379]|uniref:hypothetical protein n=1 Tax=Burkholderia sp. Ac-20379 TaxID=2703900 RepID=UPI00197FA476